MYVPFSLTYVSTMVLTNQFWLTAFVMGGITQNLGWIHPSTTNHHPIDRFQPLLGGKSV